jgi:glycine/D-amino acid oxidase-like deaminating enzyme
MAENLLLAVVMCGRGFMIGPGLGSILAEAMAEGEGAAKHGFIFDQLTLNRNFGAMELIKLA